METAAAAAASRGVVTLLKGCRGLLYCIYIRNAFAFCGLKPEGYWVFCFILGVPTQVEAPGCRGVPFSPLAVSKLRLENSLCMHDISIIYVYIHA